jgi:hypothetical protein
MFDESVPTHIFGTNSEYFRNHHTGNNSYNGTETSRLNYYPPQVPPNSDNELNEHSDKNSLVDDDRFNG